MPSLRLPAPVRLALLSGLAGLTLMAAPAEAQTTAAAAPDPSSVVVKVGNETITEADIGFAAEDLGQDLANVPPQQRRAFLVAVLIDMKVMAEAARKAELDKTDIFKRRLAYLEDRSLRRAYFADKIGAAITDDAVQAAYKKFVDNFVPQEEVRARHILVSTKEDAEAVKKAIEGGKPFEMAALENSQDSTAQNGGDLGYFSRGMMVKPFEDAAFALKVGEISDPVQTQFGWHIIKLEDKRMSSPPPLEQVKSQIQQQVMIDAFTAEMDKLKKNVAVSFTDPELEKAVQSENQAVQNAEDGAAAPASGQ